MKCLSPINIRDPVQTSNKFIAVPCGKCMGCLSLKREQWFIRLKEELRSSGTGMFVTLTYDNENLPLLDGKPTLCKEHHQKFLKRLRKQLGDVKFKYFITGEYGTNFGRPHYHILLFGIKDSEVVRKCWKYGNIDIGDITEKSINYTAKYVINNSKVPDGVLPGYSTCSKGIGIDYIKRMGDYHRSDINRNFYSLPGGVKKKLPRYYQEKLYNKEQKTIIKVKNRINYESKEFNKTILEQSEDIRLEMDRKEAITKSIKNKLKNSKL